MVVHIKGMACKHCSSRVEKTLGALDGVSATVDLAAGTATVTGDVTAEAVREAVEALGFTVVSIEG